MGYPIVTPLVDADMTIFPVFHLLNGASIYTQPVQSEYVSLCSDDSSSRPDVTIGVTLCCGANFSWHKDGLSVETLQ